MNKRVIAGFVFSLCAAAAPAQSFSFGLWGDMPYKKAGDDSKLPAVLQSINQSDIAFSIYDGDIKDGSSKCTDDVYTDALKMFDRLAKPVVYVPGDNEWTDCHRLNAGGYDPVERLQFIRALHFADAKSQGKNPIALIRQSDLQPQFSEFVENAYWISGKTLFSKKDFYNSNIKLIFHDKFNQKQ